MCCLCPLHAAPPPSCRQPTCSLSLVVLPRDPVMLWKPSAYRKQCDTYTYTNTQAGINANLALIFYTGMCINTKHPSTNWITLRYFSIFMFNSWIPHVHWDVRNYFSHSTSIFKQELQRQFVTEMDEYKIKDIQADCCDWQGQKTDSFSTLGKSEDKN